MSLSPLPAPVSLLGARRLSFQPPIRNAGANEWQYRRATWSELIFVNTADGREAAIPRALVGDIIRGLEGHARVVLRRELEWKGTSVSVVRCPVIELPVVRVEATPDAAAPARPSGPATVVSIRLEPKPRTRTGTRVAVAVMLGAVACAIVADIGRQVELRNRFEALRLSRSYLKLTPSDDLESVARKLGPPALSSSSEIEGRSYRILSYPSRQFRVVLESEPGRPEFYLGSVDPLGRILHVPGAAEDRNATDRLHLATHF